MTPFDRATHAAALVAVGLLLVPMLVAPVQAAERGEGTLTELAILETVEAHLASDGTPESAKLHTRLDARGQGTVELVDPTYTSGLRERGRVFTPATEDGQVIWDLNFRGTGMTTRRTVAEYPTDAMPISARIRYELDGDPVSADELRGSTGEAAVLVQLRNTTSEPTGVVVGSGADRQLEAVDLALPLLAETEVRLDDSWTGLATDAGRIGADSHGATVAWSSAPFEPFGSTNVELEVRGQVRNASLPSLEVDATPVTRASSELLATAEDLLTERATIDAVSAFLAATLGEALDGLTEGTAQLARGLDELGTGVEEGLGDLEDLDPEALAADAFADVEDALDPAGLDLPDLDPADLLEGLEDDLDTAALLDQLDPEALLGEFDPAALLADADLDELIELLLAEVFEELPALGLDDDVIESALAEALDELGEQVTFEELLSALDVAALLEDIDLDAALADAFDDVDLGAVLADVSEQIDVDTLLDDVDLDGLLADLLAGLDLGLGDVGGLIDDVTADATIGELLGDVDVADLVAVLGADAELELEVAATLAALLEQLDVELPTVGQAELEALGHALEAALTTVESVSVAASGALERLEDAPGTIEDPPFDDLAGVAEGLGQSLSEISEVLAGLDGRLFDPVAAALGDADTGLSAVRESLEALESDLDEEQAAQLEPARAAIATVEDAVAAGLSGIDEARADLDAFSGELDSLAVGTAELADALRDPTLLDGLGEGVQPATDAVAEVLAGLRTADEELTALLTRVDALAAGVDEEIALEDLLLEALADRELDLEPLLVGGVEGLLALLDDVTVAELLELTGLAELLDDLDLDVGLADLLADLALDDLTGLLDEADVDLATLLEDLDLDVADLLADVDLTGLLDALDLADLDLGVLLDDLDVDPADLLAGLDLETLLDDIDLTAVLGATLEGLDFGDIEDALAEIDLDLAELLAAAGLDPADLLAQVETPDLTDLLDDVDFDALIADLGLDPAALLADVDLPGLEGLLDELDLDLDALLAEAGLDDLGDLDELVGGLLEALAGLAEGGEELAAGLSQLADEGIGQLVAQLDDDARAMQRELATVRALEERAAEAQPTASPEGAETSARYRLLFEPDEPLLPGVVTLGALLLAALGAEGLRRRWTG